MKLGRRQTFSPLISFVTSALSIPTAWACTTKKLFAFTLIFFIIFPVPIFSQVIGDLDDNDVIDARDGLRIAQGATGLIPKTLDLGFFGDVDLDGQLTLADAELIAKLLTGAIDVLPGQIGIFPTSGPPGTLVKVASPDLSPVAEENIITFDGVETPAFLLEGNVLLTIVPFGADAGPSIVDIRVGGVSIAAFDFEILEAPVLTDPPGAILAEVGTNVDQALADLNILIDFFSDSNVIPPGLDEQDLLNTLALALAEVNTAFADLQALNLPPELDGAIDIALITTGTRTRVQALHDTISELLVGLSSHPTTLGDTLNGAARVAESLLEASADMFLTGVVVSTFAAIVPGGQPFALPIFFNFSKLAGGVSLAGLALMFLPVQVDTLTIALAQSDLNVSESTTLTAIAIFSTPPEISVATAITIARIMLSRLGKPRETILDLLEDLVERSDLPKIPIPVVPTSPIPLSTNELSFHPTTQGIVSITPAGETATVTCLESGSVTLTASVRKLDRTTQSNPVSVSCGEVAVTITIGDNGPLLDDIFEAVFDGASVLTSSVPVRSISTTLTTSVGEHTVNLIGRAAPDGIGTYFISFSPNVIVLSGPPLSGTDLSAGLVFTYQIEVTSP